MRKAKVQKALRQKHTHTFIHNRNSNRNLAATTQYNMCIAKAVKFDAPAMGDF